MVFNATFSNIQLYHGDQFYWWRKPEFPKRTTDHGQATGKLYHLRMRQKSINQSINQSINSYIDVVYVFY
jgi:hypothetical protein